MKKILLAMLLAITGLYCSAQKFTINDVRNVAKKIGWQPSKDLKNLSAEKLDLLFLKLNSNYELTQQMHVEGWSVCEYRKIDNLDLYNYYYTDISRATYNLYCEEICALMILDGVIEQGK